ncbi:MAG: DEAD/DEAH box helicase [Thermodesulfobacteriota bacterium]
MNFDPFKLHPHVAAGVATAGYSTPTPIQNQAIPLVMEGKDVMGLAQTGTGKTAAFALPLLHRLMDGKRGHTRALILAPTRELAEQIRRDIDTLGSKTRLRSLSVYGGVGINPQKQQLRRGVEIVVACPGRLLDHIGQGTVDLSRVETLILDEADQMFDMGFLPDIRRILKKLPANRQNLLFSATMPPEIRRLAQEILRNPATVQAGNVAPAETVRHGLYPVEQHLKTPLLLELLKSTDTSSVLVFTRTKHRAKRLGEQLSRAGYRSTSLQGNLSQNRRQAALDGFRSGAFQILVATDIAARGIDVSRVSHVINYDVPSTPEAYIHRIGRTGRATRNGDAFTLVTREDTGMVRAIDRILGEKTERRTLPDFDYTVSPHGNGGPSGRNPRPKTANKKPAGPHRTGNASNRSGASGPKKPASAGTPNRRRPKSRQPELARAASGSGPSARRPRRAN